MNEEIKEEDLTYEDIEMMLRTVVFDGYFYCPYCEYGDLESDYESCPECHKKNPLKEMGFI